MGTRLQSVPSPFSEMKREPDMTSVTDTAESAGRPVTDTIRRLETNPEQGLSIILIILLVNAFLDFIKMAT